MSQGTFAPCFVSIGTRDPRVPKNLHTMFRLNRYTGPSCTKELFTPCFVSIGTRDPRVPRNLHTMFRLNRFIGSACRTPKKRLFFTDKILNLDPRETVCWIHHSRPDAYQQLFVVWPGAVGNTRLRLFSARKVGKTLVFAELRSCVKCRTLGSQSLIVILVSVDVRQH